MFIRCDIGEINSINLQDEGSLNMLGIRELHEILLYYSIIILSIVAYMLMRISINKIYWPNIKHHTLIELIWTIIPGIILICIGIPSLQLLYFMDEVYIPDITLKIKGVQWYWTYSISDNYTNISFDSYPIEESGKYRLLEVDNRIVLPVYSDIRFLITAEDVIHSWTIPSLGIKLDAIPGRINQSVLFLLREGTYYGQCSELCGIGHPFMPIVLDVVNLNTYALWLLSHTQLLISTWLKLFLSAKDYSF